MELNSLNDKETNGNISLTQYDNINRTLQNGLAYVAGFGIEVLYRDIKNVEAPTEYSWFKFKIV